MMKFFIQIFTIYMFCLSFAPCGESGGVVELFDLLIGQKVLVAQQDANSDNNTTIYQTNYDGKNPEKITTVEDRNYYSYNKDSYIYYYNNGLKIKWFNLKTKSSGDIGNSFFYEYDLNVVRRQVFREVWGQFGLNFYDSNMHGVDWGKLYKKYEPYTQYCYDEESLSNIIEEMIGEVNASHTGFTPKRYDRSFYYQTGLIGVEFDLSKRLNNGVKFRRLYDGTSIKDFYKLEPGDLLLAAADDRDAADWLPHPVLDDRQPRCAWICAAISDR